MSSEITEKQAADIYQDLLDRIWDAYFNDDFDAFRSTMNVPHTYTTEVKEQTIETYDQLQIAFNSFRQYLIGMGITDMVRQCTGAMALGDRKIIGGHTTVLLRDGEELREPYSVWATLELTDGTWKVTSSENALSDTAWQSKAFGEGAVSG